MPKVAIVMGSDSDLDIMKEAAEIFERFDVDYKMTVISAHRTPKVAEDFASSAEENGFDVIIAGAGKAAHLGGVLAAYTSLPVIGVPIRTSTLGGADSLYSIVQMPGGVPVATVALNGAKNAALLAIQMIAVGNVDLRNKFKEYKKEMALNVKKTVARLEKMGYEKYLEEYGD